MMSNINQNKVRRLFTILQSINPLLRRYNLAENREENQRNILHAIVRLNQTVPNNNAWIHNYIMSIDNTDPIAAQHTLDDLILGLDSNNNQLSFRGEPAMLALIFPYLFTRGLGYYSLSSAQDNPANELEGGYALANSYFTISKYTKQLILSRDRRFVKCIKFLFCMLDYIEKKIFTLPKVSYFQSNMVEDIQELMYMMVHITLWIPYPSFPTPFVAQEPLKKSTA